VYEMSRALHSSLPLSVSHLSSTPASGVPARL
jgi:hypothetical protein